MFLVTDEHADHHPDVPKQEIKKLVQTSGRPTSGPNPDDPANSRITTKAIGVLILGAAAGTEYA
jgi:hypothetical protein